MKTVAADSWEINELDFPAHALPAEQWRFLLRYAVLAPSSHNSQPFMTVASPARAVASIV